MGARPSESVRPPEVTWRRHTPIRHAATAQNLFKDLLPWDVPAERAATLADLLNGLDWTLCPQQRCQSFPQPLAFALNGLASISAPQAPCTRRLFHVLVSTEHAPVVLNLLSPGPPGVFTNSSSGNPGSRRHRRRLGEPLHPAGTYLPGTSHPRGSAQLQIPQGPSRR